MSNQLVQAQWSLNETSDSVYSIARGVLQAATSDNIQPLAIMACEQFGNTLAISQETRLRIERTVLPTPEPVTIRFLKAKVGFMKHDCATQLGSNQAGLRFLALAAALITSIPPFHCAKALMLMLENTTPDKRLLPTTRHLADLMSSLEGRCSRSGFADIVYGYNSVIEGAYRQKVHEYDDGGHKTPDSEGLSALIDACRHLQRIGDHATVSVVVETRECAAWVAAFAKWSLESPPSIFFDDKQPILPQPGSLFTIIIPLRRDRKGVKIKIAKTHELDSIQDLIVSCSAQFKVNNRVPSKFYGSFIVGRRIKHQLTMDALLAALPLAITIIHNKIRANTDRSPETFLGPQPFTITQPNIFPSTDVLFKTMSLLFGLAPDFPFASLSSAKSFRDLPEVEHYLSIAGVGARYKGYSVDGTIDLSEVPWWAKNDNASQLPSHSPSDSYGLNQPDLESTPGDLEYLARELTVVCIRVLLLSLFDDTEDLRFADQQGFYGPESPDSLYKPMLDALTTTSRFQLVDIEEVIAQARMLITGGVGTSVVNNTYQNLVWSTGTHVFWYSILDDFSPKSAGTHRITSSRGRLMFERETYQTVDDDNMKYFSTTKEAESSVDFSVQLFSVNLGIRWQVTALLDNMRAALILVRRQNPETSYGSASPLRAIEQQPKRCILVSCGHSMNTAVRNPETRWKYIFPGASNPPETNPGIINVCPTNGVGELQMYYLAWLGFILAGEPEFSKTNIIIRQRACLDCCITAYEKLACIVLIL
ncbi:hypothetical protein F5Y10DRAFT_291919 [Nemania abortiva]|nr:hypothetical protein F5Y10DRAFT_291919 [Nemania abortiva]